MSLPFKKCIVVGASSGIGEAIARQLGKQGASVALIARRAEALETVKADITASGGRAFCFPHDVCDYRAVEQLFQQITAQLEGLDLIVYASGVMPIIEPDEYDLNKDLQTVEVNCMGAVAWLNQAAQRFGKEGAGTIVGISSVAGDRGRRGYPVYGASKSFLDAYLESLRNRIARTGAAVVTVKPGPVDTPMTRDISKKPLLITAEEAASTILAAAAARKRVVYVPWKWRPIMAIIRAIPSIIFKKLNF